MTLLQKIDAFEFNISTVQNCQLYAFCVAPKANLKDTEALPTDRVVPRFLFSMRSNLIISYE